MNWFSTYQGKDWKKERDGYNEVFRELILQVRTSFGLDKKVRVGEYAGEKWLRASLRGKTYHVRVNRFIWDGTRVTPGGYITPQFRISFEVANDKGKHLFQYTYVVEFPQDYPLHAPNFRVDFPKYAGLGNSTTHHLLNGSWLCIMNAGSEWNSKTETFITALNRAFDHTVWHYNAFGW